ncbi:hypothetical protein LRAMOSA09839 [Lichtheimia ramosa]|uniref:SAC domain-containing protein n=1 Tax=Lichtheimia ramosa TaxID=688394 RepID=A0A077WP49_9FUNG|nr:hypothetical protein LRAMOSA09839 [Lichtheimia ramosa]
MGFIRLHAGEYMIVTLGRECAGVFNGHEIFRATTFQILPLPRDLSNLTNTQLNDEQQYIHLLQDHLKQNTFYFSYTYDLTRSLQQQKEDDGHRGSMWTRADPRFFWNRYLVEKLTTLDNDLSQFIFPFIQGFVHIRKMTVQGCPVEFALISRRSKEHAGTRYFSRGLDNNGHASNFVETEQLISCQPNQGTGTVHMSHVQTRGSLPAIWGQIPNVRYVPRLWFNSNVDDNQVLDVSRAHFNEQFRIYGPQLLLNLVNKAGYEYPMGQLYARIVDRLDDFRLQYVHFDFHRECRGMKWDRVQVLIDELEPELHRQGFFCDTAKDRTLCCRQTSVVRSNCMDCLDRTNVVQSTLARWIINQQLHHVGVLPPAETIEKDSQFMEMFNNAWADNADYLSIAYSGTGALKTDYTRTGRRTFAGAMNDLINSLTRYAKNNFMDGSRQDGIDLILGLYTVEAGPCASPFELQVAWPLRVVPIALVSSLVLFFVILFFPSLLLPDSASSSASNTFILLLSFFFTVVVFCWRYVLQHGMRFINWPRLRPIMPAGIPLVDEVSTISRGASTISERTNSMILDDTEQCHELPIWKKTT